MLANGIWTSPRISFSDSINRVFIFISVMIDICIGFEYVLFFMTSPKDLSRKFMPTAPFRCTSFSMILGFDVPAAMIPERRFEYMLFLLTSGLLLTRIIPSVFSYMTLRLTQDFPPSIMKMPSLLPLQMLFSITQVSLLSLPPNAMFAFSFVCILFRSICAEEPSTSKIPYALFSWISFRTMLMCAPSTTRMPASLLKAILPLFSTDVKHQSPSKTIPFAFSNMSFDISFPSQRKSSTDLRLTPFPTLQYIQFKKINGSPFSTKIPCSLFLMSFFLIDAQLYVPTLIPLPSLRAILHFSITGFQSTP